MKKQKKEMPDSVFSQFQQYILIKFFLNRKGINQNTIKLSAWMIWLYVIKKVIKEVSASCLQDSGESKIKFKSY
jgi:uncharacterized membrane protein